MTRVLITGGSGLLGLNWACSIRERFDVVLGIHRRPVRLAGVRSVAIDMESPEQLARQLGELKPEIVVHAAGLASVERCERAPAEAEHANTRLAAGVAAATGALGIRLVHISTDHLFDGNHANLTERDAPAPLNVYARTKRDAEMRVAQANPQALIVRTNFFGWGHAYRQSFSDWIVANLRAAQPVTMFEDVYFTPILADALATATHEVLEKGGSGIYHIVGDQRVSKFDFAIGTAAQFGLPPALIARGRIGESALAATRPRDMSLDNAKARALLNRQLGSLDDFLAELYRQEQQGRAAELRNAVAEK